MKKVICTFLITFFILLNFPTKVEAQMIKIFLIPIEQVGMYRGPEYFTWRFDANGPSINCRWSMMDYGFINVALLVAHDITPADYTSVISHPDVFAFPDNLDQPITDPNVSVFFESLNIPTNWMTPATTYRQLLRYTAGMFQFNQRYGGLSGGASIFDGGRTLESNWNSLSVQEKSWFNQTLVSFGWLDGIQGNPKLRTIAKQAGDLWGAAPFYMGGLEF